MDNFEHRRDEPGRVLRQREMNETVEGHLDVPVMLAMVRERRSLGCFLAQVPAELPYRRSTTVRASEQPLASSLASSSTRMVFRL
jgi:hypothetical protein